MALLVCIGTSFAGPEGGWLCLGADGHVGLKVAPAGACGSDEPGESAATGASALDHSHGPCVDVPLGSAVPLGLNRSSKRGAVDSGAPSNVAAATRAPADAAPRRLIAGDASCESAPPGSALIATVVLLI